MLHFFIIRLIMSNHILAYQLNSLIVFGLLEDGWLNALALKSFSLLDYSLKADSPKGATRFA